MFVRKRPLPSFFVLCDEQNAVAVCVEELPRNAFVPVFAETTILLSIYGILAGIDCSSLLSTMRTLSFLLFIVVEVVCLRKLILVGRKSTRRFSRTCFGLVPQRSWMDDASAVSAFVERLTKKVSPVRSSRRLTQSSESRVTSLAMMLSFSSTNISLNKSTTLARLLTLARPSGVFPSKFRAFGSAS